MYIYWSALSFFVNIYIYTALGAVFFVSVNWCFPGLLRVNIVYGNTERETDGRPLALESIFFFRLDGLERGNNLCVLARGVYRFRRLTTLFSLTASVR